MDEAYLRDLFASLPDVSIRRLFGGQAVYSEGLIVAIVLRGELYLKGDEVSEPLYTAAGFARWHYERAGRSPVAMPYYRLSEDALDDPDEMRRWADVAHASARRTRKKKPVRRPGAGRPD